MRKLAEAVGQKIEGQLGAVGSRNSSPIAISPVPPKIIADKPTQNCQLASRFCRFAGSSKGSLGRSCPWFSLRRRRKSANFSAAGWASSLAPHPDPGLGSDAGAAGAPLTAGNPDIGRSSTGLKDLAARRRSRPLRFLIISHTPTVKQRFWLSQTFRH